MKKIGKKLSNMVKVLLVLGLIISNLSSLRVVFALEEETGSEPSSEVVSSGGEPTLLEGEGETDETPQVEATGLDASISEDNKITVKYGTEVNDTDELQIRITESYNYNNCEDTDSISCESIINNSYEVANTNRELLLGEGMVIDYAPSLLKNAKFDGTYKLVVTLVNVTEDKVLDEKVIDEVNNTFDTGMVFKVYDSSDKLIEATNGKYVFGPSNETIKVVGRMQAGGISPNDVFEYPIAEGEPDTYSALEILDKDFEFSINLGGYLYADFTLPISVIYSQNGEETEYVKQLSISHGKYEDNTDYINSFVDPNKFLFEGTTDEGKLYVYLSDTEITLDDISKPLYDAYYDSDNVWYRFSNEELNSKTLVTVLDGITTITYQVVIIGDVNDDGVLDENDIIALTDQLVGNEEVDLDKANIDNSDDEVNTQDLLKLSEVVKTGAWGVDVTEEEIELEATLETTDGVTEFVSGDEFEVNYVVTSSSDVITGFAGLVNYNKSILELESLTVTDNYLGSEKDGKFVYVDINDDKTSSEEVTKLLTLKFKVLSSGEDTITIDDAEFFNGSTYYKIVEIDEETGESKPVTPVISLDVTASASDDNSLSSLKLGDNEIQLEEGVYDYTLTVGNNVTTLDVSAITSNVAASITSIVSPEELVEGENTITVTVTSESGEENTYTIVVTRESAEEENNTNTNTDNQTASTDSGYSRNPSNNNNVKPTDPTKDDNKQDDEPVVEPVKEKSNLSKIIIIILILLVIAGLIYLIFKDDDDDESKKANKDINKYKKEDFDSPKEKTTNNNNKRNQNQNNKKGKK